MTKEAENDGEDRHCSRLESELYGFFCHKTVGDGTEGLKVDSFSPSLPSGRVCIPLWLTAAGG